MRKNKSKSVSVDAMVKFLMNQYSIPTAKDVEQVTRQLDRIELMLKGIKNDLARSASSSVKGQGRKTKTASDTVFDVVKRTKKGIGFAGIQSKTGFDDKKLRNIIFRLNKLNKIKRVQRGLYVSVEEK